MASTHKVLGQVNPALGVMTDLYTVPAGAQALCSTISICNVGASATYRIAVRPAGAVLAAKQYIAYEAPLSANDAVMLTLGVTLSAGDVISVQASTATVAFNVFGVEVT